jgi:hypothetical protein
MKHFTDQDVNIFVCTAIEEWAKEFYDMPEGSIFDAEQTQGWDQVMGFASIDDKTIWIFLPQDYEVEQLEETVAHELGHLAEMKLLSNPDQSDDNFDLHEQKADYFMNFYLQCKRVIIQVVHLGNLKET